MNGGYGTVANLWSWAKHPSGHDRAVFFLQKTYLIFVPDEYSAMRFSSAIEKNPFLAEAPWKKV